MALKIKVKGRYDDIEKVTYKSDKPSQTKQEYAEQCDLRSVIQRYELTGQFYNPLDIKHMSPREGVFVDVSDVQDIENAQRIIQRANDAFMSIPAAFRKAFDNNPMVFAAVLNTPGALQRMIDAGLIPDQYLTRSVKRGAGAPAPANADVQVDRQSEQVERKETVESA